MGRSPALSRPHADERRRIVGSVEFFTRPNIACQTRALGLATLDPTYVALARMSSIAASTRSGVAGASRRGESR